MIRPSTAFLILAALYVIVGTIDGQAMNVSHLMMLENSMLPATFDECQRAAPGSDRPTRVISKQQRTNEPWHHRTCVWVAK